MEFEHVDPDIMMDFIYIPPHFLLQQATSFSPLMDIEAPESPAIPDVNKYIEDLKNILQVNEVFTSKWFSFYPVFISSQKI